MGQSYKLRNGVKTDGVLIPSIEQLGKPATLKALIAQLVEHSFSKREVLRSSLSKCTLL